jgi:cysteine desulfurase/selenocysteine lyase
MRIDDILSDEALRNRLFPCTQQGIYMAHGAVAPLSGPAAEAMTEFIRLGSRGNQENAYTAGKTDEARRLCAQLIGAKETEISLLGPTALGLSLVSLGIDWQLGDEVVYYSEDYPSNVYPWASLREKGVEAKAIRTLYPGVITWDKVEPLLTERTRLVSLATCNFLSGYRPDIEDIGRRLHEREILFNVDGIQTLGAFPINVEHIDFLSADSHKWMLGPATAGLFYVSARVQQSLSPALLGSWNVVSPQFVAQEEIAFEPGGRRYEPGTLNLPGICGMAASLELLLDVGIEAIAARLLKLRRHLLEALEDKGYISYLDDWEHSEAASDRHRSGIVTVFHKRHDLDAAFRTLAENGVTASLRRNRSNLAMLRFSPHFYTREEELDQVVALLP